MTDPDLEIKDRRGRGEGGGMGRSQNVLALSRFFGALALRFLALVQN